MIPFNRYFFILIAVPVLVALVSLVAIAIVVSSSRKHIYTKIENIPNAEAALILGAAILKNGQPSPVLRDRIDQAIDLYKAGKVGKIIASGDNASVDYNEVQPVRIYLIKNGIPEEDIFMDYAGFDTYSSIYRARDVFLVESLSIVSQSFHLPRAVFIARNLGLEASGSSADRGHYKVTNYFREMAADIKAVVNIASSRKPRHLGKEIPISGDGRESLPQPKTIPIW